MLENIVINIIRNITSIPKSYQFYHMHYVIFYHYFKAVKGPLSAAFKIQELLNNVRCKSNDQSNNKSVHLDSLCFRSPSNAAVASKLLPQAGSCLILSPTRFWNGSYSKFLQVCFIAILSPTPTGIAKGNSG